MADWSEELNRAVRRFQRHFLLRQYGDDGNVLPQNMEVSNAIDALYARAESAEKRIAGLEAEVSTVREMSAYWMEQHGKQLARAESAKAALAECRAKVIEECAEAADTPETTNDFQRGMCFAATMIRALATKETSTQENGVLHKDKST